MTVDPGDELREFIESHIESGDYRTQSEVIRESIHLQREKQAESRRRPYGIYWQKDWTAAILLSGKRMRSCKKLRLE